MKKKKIVKTLNLNNASCDLTKKIVPAHRDGKPRDHPQFTRDFSRQITRGSILTRRDKRIKTWLQ